AEALPFAAVNRREHRRRLNVEDARRIDVEAALEKRRKAARHAEVRVDAARVAPFEPSSEPYSRMPSAQPRAQHRVPEVVPVDDEAHAAPVQRSPRDENRRKVRRVLNEHEVGPGPRPQKAPQPEAEARGAEASGG